MRLIYCEGLCVYLWFIDRFEYLELLWCSILFWSLEWFVSICLWFFDVLMLNFVNFFFVGFVVIMFNFFFGWVKVVVILLCLVGGCLFLLLYFFYWLVVMGFFREVLWWIWFDLCRGVEILVGGVSICIGYEIRGFWEIVRYYKWESLCDCFL